MRGIVDEEFDGAPLDLVIDDASHRLEPTRASFDMLFPRLRPGGLYIIEDWNCDHNWAAAFHARLRSGRPVEPEFQKQFDDASAAGVQPPPLTRLVVELLVAAAGQGAVDEITVDPYWVTVRRGEGELESGEYALADHVLDHLGLLDD